MIAESKLRPACEYGTHKAGKCDRCNTEGVVCLSPDCSSYANEPDMPALLIVPAGLELVCDDCAAEAPR